MRKLATAAAVSLALATGSAKALILGEIEMRSSLNQPMNAEIVLSSIADGELDGMIVKLASPEVFSRAGIDRSAVLQDLKFSVTRGLSGQPVIAVTSSKPVVEPFLNFLLEVDWTSGRMVREYTVLLDPPVFMAPNTNRSSSTDSPAITQAPSEESALVPIAIDRTTGVEAESVEIDLDQTFDESAIVVVDGTLEVGDDVIVGDSSAGGTVVDLGEIVSLDDEQLLPEVGTIIDNNAVTLTDSEVISLDDISIADNSSFSQNAGWDVQVMGSTSEVGNEVGDSVVASNTSFASNTASFNGEVVSLEDLGGSSVGSTGGGEVRVARNDTLWEIANRNKVAGMSTQQMMLALLDANEQAFINGNINLVKAGAILRIPTAGETSVLNQNEAVAQVQQQEKLWREYRDNLRGSRAPTAVASNDVSQPVDSKPEEQLAVEQVVENDAASRESAEAILNQARNELRIVADNESTSTVASATADETEASNEQAQLGGINKQVQLAREELSASRLEGEELADKGAELDSLTENMDQLVSLQQDQLAQLQAQLADARKNQTSANDVTNAVADAKDAAADTVAGVVEGAQDKINQVDLIEEPTETETAAITATSTEPVQTAQPAPVAEGPWYKTLLSDPRKAIIAGLGALGALLLGWILLRKRKRPDETDEDFLDQVQFVEDEDEFGPVADANPVDDADSTSAFGKVAAGGAAVAGAAGLAVAGDKSDAQDQTVNLGDSGAENADETLSKDDTISEAEVYLAYGLHGQAEELLTKAIDKSPDNADYQLKLLQTYHAQGNAAAFDEAAKNYHTKFDGNNNPSWDRIAEMGLEVNASNELYMGDNAPVENVGAGTLGAPTLNSSDFDAGESSVQSQVREFSSDDNEVSDMGVDETAIMDQSIDPGFAFDESDLEATGDFTQLSEEIQSEEAANETSSGIADLADNLGGSAKGAAAGLAAGAAGLAGSIGLGNSDKADAADDDGVLEFDTGDLESAVSDSTDAVQGNISGKAADLTSDLDELASDLQMDTTQMVDSGMDLTQDLEIPDLTSNIDLTADASAALGNVDEMDTMMDLAKAYIDMGDNDSASSALGEIVKSGNPVQKTEAENLLKKIS